MADYGVDIDCTDDLNPTFRRVAGSEALRQALYRRFSTPRGGLFYDETYGYDLRSLINLDLGPGDIFAIAAAIEAEARKDERVESLTASVAFNAEAQTLTITMVGEGADGPFELVLRVEDAAIALVEAD